MELQELLKALSDTIKELEITKDKLGYLFNEGQGYLEIFKNEGTDDPLLEKQLKDLIQEVDKVLFK